MQFLIIFADVLLQAPTAVTAAQIEPMRKMRRRMGDMYFLVFVFDIHISAWNYNHGTDCVVNQISSSSENIWFRFCVYLYLYLYFRRRICIFVSISVFVSLYLYLYFCIRICIWNLVLGLQVVARAG